MNFDIQIETERLLIVPTSDKYAEDIFAAYREPVTEYMNYGAPESIESLKERLDQRQEEMKNSTADSLYVIVLKKDGEEFLGSFSLEGLDKPDPELGGWLKESAQGHGYGREAAAALKQWADEHLDYDHLVWPCVKENLASRKLAESIGGKIQKEYVKTTASGKTWEYVEYWIPKA